MEIAIAAQSFCKSFYLCQVARDSFPHVRIASPSYPLNGRELVNFIGDAEAIIVGSKEKIGADILQQLPNLRYISKYGVGLDNLDLRACEERNVKVLSEPGVNADAVAELTIGLMLCLIRNISMNDRKMRSGEWHKNGGKNLHGRSVGIIGCGNVGTRVAEILKSFRCQIMIYDIEDKSVLASKLGARTVKFEECLKAEIITFHVPLTPATLHFIDAKILSAMAGSLLINTARGEIICQSDLVDNLKKGGLAGAGLDVYQNEPHIDVELTCFENVVLSPHVAGNSQEAVKAMGMAAITKLKSVSQNWQPRREDD